MGLSVPLLKAIKRKGFRLPTPIQRRAMPVILQGQDVIGMARTGSGKTAAFVIPMIEKLKAHSIKAGARAVILSPTRELALQTYKTVRWYRGWKDPVYFSVLKRACVGRLGQFLVSDGCALSVQAEGVCLLQQPAHSR